MKRIKSHGGAESSSSLVDKTESAGTGTSMTHSEIDKNFQKEVANYIRKSTVRQKEKEEEEEKLLNETIKNRMLLILN